MDKFEQWLEAIREDARERKVRLKNQHGREYWQGVFDGLEDAVDAYQKHKQDAPVFRVGQLVVDKPSMTVKGIIEMVGDRQVYVAWENGKHSAVPMLLVEPIEEESEDKS